MKYIKEYATCVKNFVKEADISLDIILATIKLFHHCLMNIIFYIPLSVALSFLLYAMKIVNCVVCYKTCKLRRYSIYNAY